MSTTRHENDLTAPPPIQAPDRPTLSVVMPAYNEEGAIEDAVRDVWEHVFPLVPDAELIVVDDGSRDRTGEILDRLAATEPRLRVIHKANGGHGPAIRTGLDAASGEFVFLIDSDRQIPLIAFPPLWEAARTRDGAFGVSKKRNDPRLPTDPHGDHPRHAAAPARGDNLRRERAVQGGAHLGLDGGEAADPGRHARPLAVPGDLRG